METTKRTKVCAKCGKELPVECFSKHSKSKDGLQYYCRDCQSKCNRQYALEKKARGQKTKLAIAIEAASTKELLAELKGRGYVWDKMYYRQFVDFDTV